jgi:uncharacterized membrane protein
MAETKQIVLAVFDNEAAADRAVGQLKFENDGAKKDAIGVMAMDGKGSVKTENLGAGQTGKGAGIGAVLGLLGGEVGIAIGAAGGAIIGNLNKKGLELTEKDRERISAEVQQGHAVVGVMTPPANAAAITADLVAAGGRVESHQASGDALEAAAKSS